VHNRQRKTYSSGIMKGGSEKKGKTGEAGTERRAACGAGWGARKLSFPVALPEGIARAGVPQNVKSRCLKDPAKDIDALQNAQHVRKQ